MSDTLLLFQVGPVQDFIAQARSTRDLWSGSFMISWMTARFVAEVRTRTGQQAEFVFPVVPPGKLSAHASQSVPTLEWQEATGDERASREAARALLPAIPNRLLAIVPGGFGKKSVEDAVASVFGPGDSEWGRIADTCWNFLNEPAKLKGLLNRAHWNRQLTHFWQTTWQLWPLSGDDATRKEFLRTPIGQNASPSVRSSLKDWMISYQLIDHRLAARRQTRNFPAWQGHPGIDKDSLTGREEALAGNRWREKLRDAVANLDPETTDADAERLCQLYHLFRTDEDLGAVNLIKRVWHRAFLEKTQDFKKPGTHGHGDTYFNIPSVPGLAAYSWGVRARKALCGSQKLEDFHCKVKAQDRFEDIEFAKRQQGESLEAWFARVDWQVLLEGEWEAEAVEARRVEDKDRQKKAEDGLVALRSLLAEKHLGSPERYYAVVAMDGDDMGRWLSGEKLGVSLTLDFHRDISRGLAQAAQAVRAVIEDAGELGQSQPHPYQGKLIYAGADDVLAILPASQAIGCARAIRDEFCRVMNAAVNRPGAAARFTISAGLAIGHIKEPLQDVFQAAERELRRAKDELGGDALAVTVFKRSGEMIRWGAPFASALFRLLQFFQGNAGEPESAVPRSDGKPRYRKIPADPAYIPPVSGRFPHRLTELLARYQNFEPRDGVPDPTRPLPLSAELKEVAEREFAHVLQQQADDLDVKDKERFSQLAREALAELLPQRGRPLQDFYNLFNLEAFIARQGE